MRRTKFKLAGGKTQIRCVYSRRRSCGWALQIQKVQRGTDHEYHIFTTESAHHDHPDPDALTKKGLPVDCKIILGKIMMTDPKLTAAKLHLEASKLLGKGFEYVYYEADLKVKITSWHVHFIDRCRRTMMENEVQSLGRWLETHQYLKKQTVDIGEQHTPVTITPADKGFVSAQEGISVTISTPFFLEGLRNVRSRIIFIDGTYKLNTNGLVLIVCGIVNAWGQFTPVFFTFSTHETAENYGKPLREADLWLKSIYQTPLITKQIMHDNDSAIFKITQSPYAPSHWPALVSRGELDHDNCAVHMDRSLSDSTGRDKFDSGTTYAKVSTMTVTQLRSTLIVRNVDLGGATKKANLAKLLKVTITRDGVVPGPSFLTTSVTVTAFPTAPEVEVMGIKQMRSTMTNHGISKGGKSLKAELKVLLLKALTNINVDLYRGRARVPTPVPVPASPSTPAPDPAPAHDPAPSAPPPVPTESNYVV